MVQRKESSRPCRRLYSNEMGGTLQTVNRLGRVRKQSFSRRLNICVEKKGKRAFYEPSLKRIRFLAREKKEKKGQRKLKLKKLFGGGGKRVCARITRKMCTKFAQGEGGRSQRIGLGKKKGLLKVSRNPSHVRRGEKASLRAGRGGVKAGSLVNKLPFRGKKGKGNRLDIHIHRLPIIAHSLNGAGGGGRGGSLTKGEKTNRLERSLRKTSASKHSPIASPPREKGNRDARSRKKSQGQRTTLESQNWEERRFLGDPSGKKTLEFGTRSKGGKVG